MFNADKVGSWFKREKPVWTAWIVLVVVFLSLAAIQAPGEPDQPRLGPVTFVVVKALMLGYFLLLVRYIRGPSNGRNPKPPYEERTLGAWGYVWRSIVLFFSTAVLLPLLFVSAGPNGYGILFLPLLVAVPPILCWLFFGKGRLEIIKTLIGRPSS